MGKGVPAVYHLQVKGDATLELRFLCNSDVSSDLTSTVFVIFFGKMKEKKAWKLLNLVPEHENSPASLKRIKSSFKKRK